MGLIDKIKRTIYSDTIEKFNDLYENHYEALDAFIRGYQPFNVVTDSSDKMKFFNYRNDCEKRCEKIKEEWYAHKRNVSISSMKYLVDKESTIIELFDIYMKHAKIHGKIRNLVENYPHAFASYCRKLGISINNGCDLPKALLNKKCSININDWSELSFELRAEIFKQEKIFDETENKLIEQIKLEKWITKQKEFGTKYRLTRDEILKKWGCYFYDIDNILFQDSHGTFRVWQFFPHAYCLEEDINYHDYTLYKDYGKRIFKEKLYYNCEDWIDKDLINFLNNIDEAYSVVFCDLQEALQDDVYKYENHPGLISCLEYSLFWTDDGLTNNSYFNYNNLQKNIDNIKQNIIVIDAITNNKRLRSIVNDIVDITKHQQPNIIYISIYKEYDKDEMLSIIEIRENAKAITTDCRYKRGYDYYVSTNEFKPILSCGYEEWKKIISNKSLFEDKTKELEYNDNIQAILKKAIQLAEASHVEQAQKVIIEAEHKRLETKLSVKEDEELKALIEETKNKLNIEYIGTGFSEEWKELRVDYSAPKEFLQIDNWMYAISKFPEKGTVLYPYRRRKTARTGHLENKFLEQLREWLPTQVQPIHDICINVSDDSRPYEPDIALFIEGHETIRIDVEIDEPYAAFSKEPIHYITCGDEYRDDLLNRHGWIVVRFAEKQIKKYPKSCVLYLVKLIKSLVPEMVIPTDLLSVNPLPPMKRWSKNEAIIMAANGEREKYLDHVFSKTEEIKIELADIRLNENERKCQSLVKASAMSIDMTEKMVNFTDSGVYERDKYIDFTPFEHIYIYKGTEQLLPVSSLVAYFFEKFNALEQAEKKSERYHKPVEYYLKLWDKIGKLASEVGTFVHLQTENYFKNGEFETEYQFEYEGKFETINVKKEKEHFLNFIKDFSIIPYRQEWPIYDVDLNIAGTIDLICKEHDDEYSIYDWKRSSKIIDAFGQINVRGFNNKMSFNGINVPDTAYYHYCIQQNLYRYMLEKNYGIKIKSMNLVVLCPEYSKYYKVNVPVMDEVIGSIVSICKEKNLGHRLLN